MTVAAVAGTLAVAAPSAVAAHKPDAVQRQLDALVRDDGAPGALGAVRRLDGRTRSYTAGVGDVRTGEAVPGGGQVRIGSNTKTFTAVVVLQLVGEGRIRLDAPVERYLPGAVDGSGITVRQILQHTSGLPDYTRYLDDEIRPYRPRELLDIALRHPADFAPGEQWAYSNTNYVLAGLVVQEVTHRPLAEQIDQRIIRHLGLLHTYFPAPGEATIRQAHPHGYYREATGGPLIDITEMDPSWAWAAGQLVSTASDLNRFFGALVDGRLLRPAQLAEMRRTVDAGRPFAQGSKYGLGLVGSPLSCGGVYWGHGGSIPGYETRGGATGDGRAASITITVQPGDETTARHLEAAVDTALCSAGRAAD
ncbi:serine hydrolase domain-containing protein [Kitasatospora sp. NPDC008115]|uniref:serine hydrolase domain-containing protein n=1 Tax=Kitasatospora sp. NPDC008115 TaxID=3364022 RepID=UPI0036E38903